MRSPTVTLSFAVVLLTALLWPGALGPGAAVGVVGAHQQQADQPVDPGTLVIEIHLQRNGNAHFVVATAFALENERDRDAFTDLGSAFESGDAELDLGLRTFERASALASNATGRDMRVKNVERTATVLNDTGELRLRFTWTNFAETTGDLYRIGDAFNTTSGTWLSSLSANQSLLIRSPPGSPGVVDAPTSGPNGAEVHEGNLIWRGPATFEPGYLRATFQPGEPTPTRTTETGDQVAALVGTSVVGIGVIALLAYWLLVYRKRPGSGPGPGAEPEPEAGDDPPTATESGAGADADADAAPDPDAGSGVGAGSGAGASGAGTAEPATEASDAASASGGAGAAGAAGAGAAASPGANDGASPGTSSTPAGAGSDGVGAAPAGEDDVDPSLLSDEERVEHLLQQNGRRMKQANIVTETGWSNAKVSQLLSSMAEDDRVKKLRIGRENLIALPEEDIGEFEED